MIESVKVDGSSIKSIICDGSIIWEESQNIPYKGRCKVQSSHLYEGNRIIIFILSPKIQQKDGPVYRNVKLNGQKYGKLVTGIIGTDRIVIIFPDTVTHISVGQTYAIELD